VKILADAREIELDSKYNRSARDFIMGDAFWLQQTFANILSNAIKFSPEKTRVTINIQRSNDGIEVAVTDEGAGIAPHEINLIFERFQRLQSAANVSGSGLGLPIAKELIEMHQGSISVRSELGKGSTFIVRLPIAATEGEPAESAVSSS
jgi:two-component system sensor histidine kinase SenX3